MKIILLNAVAFQAKRISKTNYKPMLLTGRTAARAINNRFETVCTMRQTARFEPNDEHVFPHMYGQRVAFKTAVVKRAVNSRARLEKKR